MSVELEGKIIKNYVNGNHNMVKHMIIYNPYLKTVLLNWIHKMKIWTGEDLYGVQDYLKD